MDSWNENRSIRVALDRLKTVIEQRLPIGDAPGVAIGITAADRLLATLECGVADRDTGQPITRQTRFPIASVSKSFAALLTMQEVEAGRIDLDAPVTDYVPWFAVRSAGAPITVRHLLSHTSGLIAGSEIEDTATGAVRRLRETVSGFAPGEHFWYSNDGYKLVGLVLEATTGQPFPDLLAERIFAPVGMRESFPSMSAAAAAVAATGHARRPNDRPSQRRHEIVATPWQMWDTADGSIVSTATDMCAYIRALLRRGSLDYPQHGHARLVDERSFDQMAQPLVEDPDEPGAYYGYGLATRRLGGRTILGHTGSITGFSSLLALDVEADLGVIILLNGYGERWTLLEQILGSIRAALSGSELPPLPPPPDPAFVEDPEAYAGSFVPCPPQAGSTALDLVAADHRLLLRRADGALPLEPCGADRFLVPQPQLDMFELRFRRVGPAVTEVTHGSRCYRREGLPAPADPPVPDLWHALSGHYRADNPHWWSRDLRVVVRGGALFAIAPWLETGEDELVPLGGEEGSIPEFRVGSEERSPSRLRFVLAVEGRADRAIYDLLDFDRVPTA